MQTMTLLYWAFGIWHGHVSTSAFFRGAYQSLLNRSDRSRENRNCYPAPEYLRQLENRTGDKSLSSATAVIKQVRFVDGE